MKEYKKGSFRLYARIRRKTDAPRTARNKCPFLRGVLGWTGRVDVAKILQNYELNQLVAVVQKLLSIAVQE